MCKTGEGGGDNFWLGWRGQLFSYKRSVTGGSGRGGEDNPTLTRDNSSPYKQILGSMKYFPPSRCCFSIYAHSAHVILSRVKYVSLK